MTLKQYLIQVKERSKAATPEPWKVVDGNVLQQKTNSETAECYYESDADFIAHARTDVEVLLEMVETSLICNRQLMAIFNVHKNEISLDHGNSNIETVEYWQKKLESLVPNE